MDYLLVPASVIKHFLSPLMRVSKYQTEVKDTPPLEVIFYKGKNLATFDIM
jgi:hypothetical protein